jgi:hypothetical protein
MSGNPPQLQNLKFNLTLDSDRLVKAHRLIHDQSDRLRQYFLNHVFPQLKERIDTLRAGFVALGKALVIAMPEITFQLQQTESSIRRLKRYKKYRPLFKQIQINTRLHKREWRKSPQGYRDTSSKRNPNRRKWQKKR